MDKILVQTLGGTIDPLVFSIESLRPDRIFIISSEDTKKYIEMICDLSEFNISKENIFSFIVKPNDLQDCFRVCLQIINSVEFDKNKVFIDYTGGTKNMSVALAMASFGKGGEYVYIGGTKRDKEGVGRVIPGSENLLLHCDPDIYWGLSLGKKIEQLFKEFNFYKVLAVCDPLKMKIDNSGGFDIVQSLAQALYWWDIMDYQKSSPLLNRIVKQVNDEDVLYFSINVTDEFKNHLNRCREKNTNAILQDIYLNALRRKDKGMFDEAVLRLYRCIELVAQLEFKNEFSCLTSDVVLQNLNKEYFSTYELDNIKSRYYNKRIDKIQIPLGETFNILNKVNNEKANIYFSNKNDFSMFQFARNNSILAHGFRYCEKSDVELGERLLSLLGVMSKKLPIPKIKFQYIEISE